MIALRFIHILSHMTVLFLLCLPMRPAVAISDQYAVISQKNLFRPDRSEWISAKHGAPAGEDKIDPDRIELFGTIIVGDKRSALIYQDTTPGKKKGKKASQSSTRRSRKGKRAEIYYPGDYLGGYIVSAIDEKKVVLDYYGDKETLYLHEGKVPPKGDYTPLGVSKPNVTSRSQPKAPGQKTNKKQQQRKQGIEREIASGQVPAELARVMSGDQLKKLLNFNQQLMKELRESGGKIDQHAVKQKIEAFRKKMLESL